MIESQTRSLSDQMITLLPMLVQEGESYSVKFRGLLEVVQMPPALEIVQPRVVADCCHHRLGIERRHLYNDCSVLKLSVPAGG